MATPQPGQQPRSFGEWFVLGMSMGALYSLWRNPQGCGCCGCLVLVLALILGALVIGLVLSAWQSILVILVAVVLLKALQSAAEKRDRDRTEQHKRR